MPRLPCKDALFFMMNSFKRVFPIFFLFPSAHMNGVLPCEKNESDFSLWASRGALDNPYFGLAGSAVLCNEHQGACAWAIC